MSLSYFPQPTNPSTYSVAPYSSIYQQIPYPNPFDPGNPIYQGTQVVAGIGDVPQHTAKAIGDSLSDFWGKSGNTIMLYLLGIGLLAVGTFAYVVNFVHPGVTVVGPRYRVGG